MKLLVAIAAAFVYMNSSAQYCITADSIADGKITHELLTTNYAWYAQGYANYKPDEVTMAQLKPYTTDLRFVVVLGTWCGDSREHIPPFMKVMHGIEADNNQVELIGTLRNKTSSKIDVSSLHIEYVPTFIVFYRSKEIGRIIEDTIISLENDLLTLILNAR